MTGPRASGIVLAGGRSTRFGADKLRADVRGRPLLEHPILALAEVCGEVLVALAADAPEPTLPGVAGVPIRIVRDAVDGAGPLAGLVAGLEAAGEGVALVVGGDQPDLRPELLRLLVSSLGTGAAAVLADGDAPRSLPLVVRRDPALAAARRVLGSERRSLLGVIFGLGAVVLPESTWRMADPEGSWRRDVDRPEDLPGHRSVP
ncbi:MAG TPA: molybdenum cofactor guanylyltransferase [Candidatus Limnocylindrales bacterium]|nr:MAG: Molybdopterin-guanine dinucleotide biosynthesis protein [Chloroflexi bacterium CSP1-4]HKY88593.1 molybdenum cofactor guanylyltransferase [Candidatus Limnocylindrales bacterium]